MKDGLEYLGRARLQGLALLLLAFLVGALAGAAGERWLTRPRAAAAPPPRETEGRPRLPRVLEDMDLTPAQRGAIDSILASGRPRNEAILQEVLPRLRAVSDSLHAGIRSVLAPAQVAEFDAYLESHPPRMPSPPREGEGGAEVGGRPPRPEQPAGVRDDRRPPPADERDGRRPPPADERDGQRPPPAEGRDGQRPPPPAGGAPPPPRGQG